MRRTHRILGLFTLGIALTASTAALGQDFDPRHRPRPQPPRPQPGPGPGPRPEPTRGPSIEVLIARYTGLIFQPPLGASFPLQRLAQLYRDRDGNILKLITEFEGRANAAGAQQYAATIALAAFYKMDGRGDLAARTYERAIPLNAGDATALLALGTLLQDRAEPAAARTRFEQALPMQTVPIEREQTVRTLMTLSLDLKDWAGAKRWHTQLVGFQRNSIYVKGELGRELYNRGEYERSESEFKELVAAVTGDNRALAPALKELGRAQGKAKKNKEALETLKRALAVAGQEAAVRAEIYEIVTEIYRAEQQLPVLVKQLEDEHPGDYARLALLGALYEETGDTVRAIETYRRALAVNPRQLDLRLRMIRLLQANGELEKAIAEYEGLIRASPNNPKFVFEQCDALIQRGERARALKLLQELEARASTDEEVLSQLADFYTRINANDLALKVLQRLAQVSTTDPDYLIDLGDRYFQDGNHPLALQTWKRILVTITPRAKALAAIGKVYLEHDMIPDALVAFKEAVQLEPAGASQESYKKSLAEVYERMKNYHDARVVYQELADTAKRTKNASLQRDTRAKLVSLWGLEKVIEQQVAPLTAQFNANPPDVESGRLLAEVYHYLRKVQEEEGAWRRVITLDKSDGESYLALERTLSAQNKLAEAITVLQALIEADPKRARDLYQKMATYALQLYRDEDAIRFAAKAVELNPHDAEGHKRLAEMYRSKQDMEHAIHEFRAALAKNDRMWMVYFELADLLLSKGQPEEADRLFRRVVRSAPDEDLVARAARLSMQINLGKGTLEELEKDLLPLAIGNPQKGIYRRLLVEIYGNLSFGLVQRVRHGRGKDAEEARATLAKIGARAVKPLLDALADQDVGQQRIAIDVLGYVDNKNAALPLFSFATGASESALRTRAMIASGALRDVSLLPRYEALLFPKDSASEEASSTDSVAIAAVWGVAKLGDPKAVPLLRRVTKSGSPQMRALAVLGLGMAHDKSSVADVTAIARAMDAGNVARAAAAYSLGELDAVDETATLLTIAQGSDPLPRQMALIALARMGAAHPGAEPPGGRAALAAMADAIFSGGDPESARARAASEALRRAGSTALTLLAAPRLATTAQKATLPVPDGVVNVEPMLESLVPRAFSDEDTAAAFVKYADALQRAALGALQTSGDRARSVLDALAPGDGAFEPLVSKDVKPGTEAAHAKAREVAKALEPSIIPLVRHPDPSIRTKAIVLLARSSTPAASAAVVLGVDDPSESVQRVALSAVGKQPNPRAVTSVGRLLTSHENWAMRVLAAQAMGRLGANGSAAEALRLLQQTAAKDTYALVREAALRSLATFDARAAKELATQMAARDAEPRVREAAQAIAAGNLN